MVEYPLSHAAPLDAIYRAVAPRGGFRGRAFRLKFAPFALTQIVPGACPFAVMLWQGPQEWRVWLMALLTLKIMGGGALVAAVISRCFPVIANEHGVRARNFWGQAREVAWNDITQVSPIRWLIWTKFARLSTPKCRHIVWLPLFLSEQTEFESAVAKWAPRDNALRQFFEKDKTAG